MLVQTLVAKLAVEALDVGILRELDKLVEGMAHALGLRPRYKGSADELGPLACAHGQRVTAKPRYLLPHAHDVLAADAVVDGDIHALVAEVIGDGQALDAPATGQAVGDKVHAPNFISVLALVQRNAFELQALYTTALAHRYRLISADQSRRFCRPSLVSGSASLAMLRALIAAKPRQF